MVFVEDQSMGAKCLSCNNVWWNNEQQLFCFKEWCKVCLWCLFLYILFLNNSSKNSVCHGVAKNLNSEQMIIKFFKLSKHRTMNLFCLKTRLQCIYLKLGVAHGLQSPFVHFSCLLSTSEKFWANTYETEKGNHSCFSTLFDLFKMPIVINNNNFGHWRKVWPWPSLVSLSVRNGFFFNFTR